MLVHFRKTGPHRYAVLVERERAPALVAHSAPGYDDYLPHDLLHVVAEAEWGLDGAVFGQLAAGGDPGIFLPVDPDLVAPWVRRRKLRPKAHPKGRRSELLAYALECAWNARRRRRPLPDGWDDLLAAGRVDRERACPRRRLPRRARGALARAADRRGLDARVAAAGAAARTRGSPAPREAPPTTAAHLIPRYHHSFHA